MPLIDKVLWGLTTVLPVLVLFRLLQQFLIYRYRAFAAMLGAGVARDLLLMCVPYTTPAYRLAWMLSLPVLLLVQTWASVAAYQAIASIYPKIGKFAPRLFAACLFAAAFGCALLLPVETRLIGGRDAPLRCLLLAYRWIDSLAAGGLLLAVAFLSRFPAPLKLVPRNLKLHTGLLAAYFSAYGVTCLLENATRLGSIMAIERIHFALIALLYAGWGTLSAQGERSEAWPQIDARTKGYLDQRDAEARAFFAGK
jgi:hypothetical protein